MTRSFCDYNSKVDYFAVLGVHFDACPKTVKLAYRKMARRYHPDVSKIHDAQKKFQEMAFAYEVLSKYRDTYCADFLAQQRRNQSGMPTKSEPTPSPQSKYAHTSTTSDDAQRQTQKDRAQNDQGSSHGQSGSPFNRYRAYQPINGKDRAITYPLTLRYAIRLLKLGTFYIPALKVQMKFTREALEGKTFRLAGKGYSGLYGGQNGDYLVRFEIKSDNRDWLLKGADLYGRITVEAQKLVAGTQLKVDVPTGACEICIPADYQLDQFVCVEGMGLPAQAEESAGHLYTLLIPA
ncbi:MAG: DnaJ domain-containing protein [Thiotrichales bacterium]|nr:DnaJ domain-containing protein [Thiotrichales bacterium]